MPHNTFSRIGAAAAATSFGIVKFLAHMFLAQWQSASAGQSDIAARGTWLLALYLPVFAVIGVVVTISAILIMLRYTKRPARPAILPVVLGSAVGASLGLFGIDPIALVLNAIPISAAASYQLISAGLAAVVTCAGLILALHTVRSAKHTAAA